MRQVAWDTETYPIVKVGKATKKTVPRMVCMSWWDGRDGGVEADRETACSLFVEWLEDPETEIIGLNAPFDLNVMIRAVEEELDQDIGPLVRDEIYDGRIREVIEREQLVDIARGGIFCRGGYALKDLAKRHLGVDLAESKSGPDVWRLRYNELDGVPIEKWPDAAVEYAETDAVLTYRAYKFQESNYGGRIRRAQEIFQTQTAWMFSLIGAWGLAIDPEWASLVDAYYARQQEECAEVLRREEIIVEGTLKRAAKRELVESAWKSVGSNPILTEKGNISTSRETLDTLTHEHGYRDGGTFDALIGYNRATTFRSTYMDPILDADRGPLCPRYNTVVNSGRSSSCIAEGTMIQVVGAGVEGKPIEDVKAGDLVWCFDDDLKPRVEPVEWAGKTGHEKVVRVHWTSQGQRTPGYVDCTPDHLIRRTDGTWCRADELDPGDHVMAISRGIKSGYIHAYATGGFDFREHRYAYEQVHGDVDEVVHHRNGDKLDNRIANLDTMSLSDHSQLHASEIDESVLRQRGKHLRDWRENASPAELEAATIAGPNSWNWLGLSYTWLVSKLHEYAGRPAIMADAEGVDYDTLIGYFNREGVEWKEIRRFFNGRNEFMDEEFVKRGRALKRANVRQPDLLKAVGLGFYRWRDIQDEYGYKPFNHRVESVEVVEDEVDVYDLHVPPWSNFIANQICVHNSGPNIQNFPARLKPEERRMLRELDNEYDSKIDRVRDGHVVGPDIRGCIVPRDGSVIVAADYSALEMATLAQVIRNWTGEVHALGQAINEGMDLHCYVASHLVDRPYEECYQAYLDGEAWIDLPRDVSKVVNYSAPVGAYTSTIVSQGRKQGLWEVTFELFKKAHMAWENAFPEMKAGFYEKINEMQRSRGGPYWVEQHGPNRATSGWRLRMADKRTEAANSMFQGLAADGAKYAGWLLMDACYFDEDSPLFGSRILAFVHDEYVLECPQDSADECGAELSRLMVEGMNLFVPDIAIEADYEIQETRWAK